MTPQNDAMLTDEASLQKARSKFMQAYEGNMMVRGEGEDVWYQRLWRTLEPECYAEGYHGRGAALPAAVV